MSFCAKCGHQLVDGAKFCFECGTKVEVSTTRTSASQQSSCAERKQEYAGKIIKCPACGAELASFVAICPDCGHEIHSHNISASLEKFVESINEYDKIIANNPAPPKKGWKTWSAGRKILWIILNIVTLFVPMVVYLVFPLIKPFVLPKSVPALTVDEKRKAVLIENYVFPNEREALLEAMLLIKSKMAFIASGKFNSKTLYWANLWYTKAEQINQRANIILKDDKIAESTYADIVASKNVVAKRIKTRALIGVSIIVVYIACVLIGRSIHNQEKPIVDNTSTTTESAQSSENYPEYEWPSSGLSMYLPKPETAYGKVRTDDEERFCIDLFGVTAEQFDAYVKVCKEKGFTINTTKTDSVFYAYHPDQYKLDIFYREEEESLEIFLDAPMPMTDIKWPDNKLVNQIPKPDSLTGNIRWENSECFGVYIANTTPQQYSDYVDRCMKAGFTIDYSRGEKTFHAYNKKGYYLVVEQHLFDKIYISIKVPEKD